MNNSYAGAVEYIFMCSWTGKQNSDAREPRRTTETIESLVREVDDDKFDGNDDESCDEGEVDVMLAL